jgi:small subunit ribosomal protein S9
MEMIQTVGRRKTAVARVHMTTGEGKIMVNGKEYTDYFPILKNQIAVEEPFKLSNTTGTYNVKVNVQGGGVSGQAEATRLAISRALIKFDATFREVLKKNGLLKRDPRMVERKKPGRPKARKNFQFRKR